MRILLETGKNLEKISELTEKAKICNIDMAFFSCTEKISSEINLLKDIPLLKKPLTKRQVLNMKPSELRKLLESRTDIPSTVHIDTPCQLKTYDLLNNIMIQKNIPASRRAKLLSTLPSDINAEAVQETIPKLVDKGYDIEFLMKLHIDDTNKNFVERVLKDKYFIESMISEKKLRIQEKYYSQLKEIIDFNKQHGRTTPKEVSDKYKQKALDEIAKTIDDFKIKIINNILEKATPKTIKYAKDCYKFTGEFYSLPYWNKESLQIINKYLKSVNPRHFGNIMDIIYRRNHNLASIKKIYNNCEINIVNKSLLEYKNFDKFKDIDIKSFKELSVADKKELIDSYASTIPTFLDTCATPLADYAQLGSKMKIYNNLDVSSKEKLLESYYTTLRRMLDSLPKKERIPITKKVEYGEFAKKYRERNPIPSLVDDLSEMPYKIETYNNESYKVIEITEDIDASIATHRIPRGNSILNVEAMEETNEHQILCTGLTGGRVPLNWDPDMNEYALVVKPRLTNDWWLQAWTDFNSGTSAQKNIYSVGNIHVRRDSQGAVTRIPELIKKELDLSQVEYTRRIKKIKERTLKQIEKEDFELAQAIRQVVRKNRMYEGLMRPEITGIAIDSEKSIEQINENILRYCKLRDIPLVRIKSRKTIAKEANNANKQETDFEFTNYVV